ncbi:hypothetical protein XBJ2_2400002 [Xenorhabdus bovienii str. Jollieti]|nr:hypothetical protein XBJ2_2400002 [Xenorhabdus bovienii str. Jollieti]
MAEFLLKDAHDLFEHSIPQFLFRAAHWKSLSAYFLSYIIFQDPKSVFGCPYDMVLTTPKHMRCFLESTHG